MRIHPGPVVTRKNRPGRLRNDLAPPVGRVIREQKTEVAFTVVSPEVGKIRRGDIFGAPVHPDRVGVVEPFEPCRRVLRLDQGLEDDEGSADALEPALHLRQRPEPKPIFGRRRKNTLLRKRHAARVSVEELQHQRRPGTLAADNQDDRLATVSGKRVPEAVRALLGQMPLASCATPDACRQTVRHGPRPTPRCSGCRSRGGL